jgi:hypothetical protein
LAKKLEKCSKMFNDRYVLGDGWFYPTMVKTNVGQLLSFDLVIKPVTNWLLITY